MKLSEELAWRGFVNQTTYQDLSALDNDPVAFYWGVDPSADSMTIGHLGAAMMVKCFIRHGHKPVLLVGGATGMIGDPDGKAQERQLIPQDEVSNNKRAIIQQYHQLFGQDSGLKITDNYDWFKDFKYLDFLRDVGKHVPMRQMLARDFVRSRLGDEAAGISYAEFSYVLIQAYDFLELYKSDDHVTLQLCGADQWGNSVAGVDLIRRLTGGEAHVLSMPLIINKATGKKFGKTEEGAVWLDPAKTSPYKFYQFWLNVDDEGVEGYLKIFTELDKPAIENLLQEFSANRSGRLAQKTLANEVTKLVHGEDQAQRQKHIAEAVAAQTLEDLDESELSILRAEIPYVKLSGPTATIQVMSDAGLASSNSEARQLLAGNAIYVNGQPFNKEQLGLEDSLGGRLLIRRGKAFRDSALVEFEN